MEPENEQKGGEMDVRQAAAALGVSRQTVGDFLKSGALSSRVVLENNRAKHLIPEADVQRLLGERQQAAAAQMGKKGRPIALPQRGKQDGE